MRVGAVCRMVAGDSGWPIWITVYNECESFPSNAFVNFLRMSTAAPVRPETSRSKPAATVNRTDYLIEQRITEACRALWWAEMVRNCLRLVLGAMAWTLVWLIVDQWIYSPGMGLRVVVWIAAVACACWYVWNKILPLLRMWHKIYQESGNNPVFKP